MQPLPHHYHAQAQGGQQGSVRVLADSLDAIETSPPPEFGGPGGDWSPETLLIASIADCYVLSFRAVARASRLEWHSLAVDVEGVLDRVDGVTRFTRFTLRPRLRLAQGASDTLARTLLDKSKRSCLISNSLLAECVVEPVVDSSDAAAAIPA